jgi:hypothetical protein
MEELYNLPWKDAIGKTDFDIQSTNDVAKTLHNEDLKMMYDDNITPQQFKFTLTINDKEISFIKHKIIFKDANGNPELLLGVLQDISNVKNIENVGKALMASIAGDVIDRNRSFIINKTSGKLPKILKTSTE